MNTPPSSISRKEHDGRSRTASTGRHETCDDVHGQSLAGEQSPCNDNGQPNGAVQRVESVVCQVRHPQRQELPRFRLNAHRSVEQSG